MKKKQLIKLTILLASSLTAMSGAAIAPSLPQIAELFKNKANAQILSKLILTAPALSIAIFSFLFGIMIDKLGRLKLMYIMLISYAIAGCSSFFVSNIYLILLGRIFLGISIAGIQTSATTLAGDYYYGAERNNFMGIQSAFMALGGIVFIGLGGFLADLSWRSPFLIYSFSLVVFIFAIIFLNEPSKNKMTLNEEKTEQKLLNINAIVLNYGIIILGMFLFYMLPVQIPFLIKKMGYKKNIIISLPLVIGAIFTSLSSFYYKEVIKKIGYKIIYQIAFSFICLGFFMIFLSTNLYLLIPALAVSGLGIGFLIPNSSLWVTNLSNFKMRGKIIGGLTSFLFLGQFLSPIVVKPLIDQFDINTTFGLASIFALFIMVLLFLYKEKKTNIGLS